MSGGDRIAWYVSRLARMSPPELAHRVIERGKQFADARRRWSWDSFSFEGAIAPLWELRLDRAAACLTPQLEAHARAILRGEIELLSTRWPETIKPGWQRGDIWTLDPVSGQHWPGRGAPASKQAYRHADGFGDVKLVWELNRLQYLMPLAVAARRDRDARLAAEISDVFDGWMEANPPFEGINWTNGIEAATRTVVALALNTLLADFSPPEFQARLRQFLGAHVWILARYPSLFSSANNHRVAELTALYLGNLAAPNLPNAAAGRAHARRALEREISRQFHVDGVGAEQSPTYAAYSLEWFLLAAICGAAADEPFSPGFLAGLAAAAGALRWFMDDAGRIPAIGDDDDGRVVALGPVRDFLYPAAICAATARFLGGSDYVPATPTLLDAFVDKPAQPPSELIGARTFKGGGYSVWRTPSARGTIVLAFDHGPLGFLSIAAHGHADALAVWMHIGADPFIIDAGTYLYHAGGEVRDQFRGTLFHNTLAVSGASQSTPSGPFNWSQQAKTRLVSASSTAVVAEHDGYVAGYGLIHMRCVAPDGHDIEIVDTLSGTFDAPRPWSAGFTFHPNVALTETESGVEAQLPSGVRVRVRVGFVAGGDLKLAEVQVSPGFSRLEPTRRLVLSGEAVSAGALATTTFEILD